MRRAFPRRLYARRALVETVFSTVKRKLSTRAPGRNLFRQLRQALLLGLAYNLYRLLGKWFPGERTPRNFAMSTPAMLCVISTNLVRATSLWRLIRLSSLGPVKRFGGATGYPHAF